MEIELNSKLQTSSDTAFVRVSLHILLLVIGETLFVQVSPAVPRRPASSLGGGGGVGLLLPEDRGGEETGGGGRRRGGGGGGLLHSRSMGGEGGLGEKATSLARDSHPILKSRSNC